MLTQGTPVCFWKCACVCVCVGDTGTLESLPSRLDLGANSKDDKYRDGRIPKKQVPSACAASLPCAPSCPGLLQQDNSS